jgi:hypothetical protein
MPQKFLVRGSLLPGQPFYCRAGRGWGSDPKLIEVLDQDECPKVANRVPGLPDVPDPVKVGRKAFEILLKDPRISIKPEGAESAEALASQVPGMQAKLAESESKVSSLESELNLTRAEMAVLGAKMETLEEERDAESKLAEKRAEQVKDLQAKLVVSEKALAGQVEKVSTLEALLGDATKPVEVKPEAVKKTESDKKGNAPKA